MGYLQQICLSFVTHACTLYTHIIAYIVRIIYLFTLSLCVDKCVLTSGETCVFPFKKHGKTCPGPTCCNLDDDPKGNWCSTKTDENGNHIAGHFGYCKNAPCDPGINHYLLVGVGYK